MRCISRSALLAVALLLTGLLQPAAAGLLFERSLGINRSANIFSTDRFDLDLSFGDSFFPANPIVLFDDAIISPADVGTTLEVDLEDSALVEAAVRLTDGLDQFIHLTITEDLESGLIEQRGWQESFFFLGLSEPELPDLLGTTIERISLRIDQFAMAAPESLTLGPAVDLRFTVSIYGQIPEPASVWISLVVAATLGAVRRRTGHDGQSVN